MAAFKSRLDKVLLTLPDCPPTQGYVRKNNNSIIDWLTESSSSWRITYSYQEDGDERAELDEEVEQPGLPQPASQ